MAARAPRAALPALALAAMVGCGPRPGEEAASPPADAASPPPVAAAKITPRRAGRPAVKPDREWVAAARARMRQVVDGDCGPYQLITDAEAPALIALCQRIGSRLDEVYAARFGLRPVGEPRGAVLLFARRSDFRAYATEVAGLRGGYAGFSRAARGLVALPADEATFATTLAHELTHLVNRRSLGPDLAPWLAEGLSDAIGDAVGPGGLEELRGIAGVEPQARRLHGALASDDPPRLAALAARRRGQFDRGVPSFDYEHSALAVRMLLTDGELAAGFRRFLAALAAGEPDSPRRLPRELGVGWSELDRRLAEWLADELSPA